RRLGKARAAVGLVTASAPLMADGCRRGFDRVARGACGRSFRLMSGCTVTGAAFSVTAVFGRELRGAPVATGAQLPGWGRGKCVRLVAARARDMRAVSSLIGRGNGRMARRAGAGFGADIASMRLVAADARFFAAVRDVHLRMTALTGTRCLTGGVRCMA